jgi:hypothetical protein
MARRVRADVSVRRALEMAVDSREAAPWQGVRWQSTGLVNLESPLGERHEATQAGGESQPEERHGMAAEVLVLDRFRENPVHRVFE